MAGCGHGLAGFNSVGFGELDNNAGVAELVDAQVSKTCSFGSVSSILTTRTSDTPPG